MSTIAAHRLLMRSALRAKAFGISYTRVISRSGMHNIAVANARGFSISARLASPTAKPKAKATTAKAKTVKKSTTAKAKKTTTTKKAAPKRKTATTAAKKKAAPKKKKAVPKEEKAPTPRTDPSLRPPPRRVTAMGMFVKRMYPTLSPKPESAPAGLSQLASMWRGMSPSEKKPYEDEAAEEQIKRRKVYEKWRAELTQGEVRTINEYLTTRKATHKRLGRDHTSKRPATGFVKFFSQSLKDGTIDVSKRPAGQNPATYGALEAAKLWKGMTDAQKAVYKS